ncbi:TPA: NrdH-redoxin [Candidatus Woesearchaeota archaeon]|jgi:glutaredoxin|nr:NrdH-redoxin [archaeon]HIJ10959.1 NrdH-redoxin [Candidatus Woesearchaeota archaeon]|tara:strand:+ start:1646 stop:1873 length:228 start_codon:yes stop_codon:yes gene_type:complete
MKILLYASPSDPWSDKAAKWLKKNKVEFEYLDVMDNHKLWIEVISKSNQLSTPVFDIDGKILVGFDEAQLSAVLT